MLCLAEERIFKLAGSRVPALRVRCVAVYMETTKPQYRVLTIALTQLQSPVSMEKNLLN